MPRRVYQQLTAKGAEKLKEPGRYLDGNGLYLQVSPTGSKSWFFRYMIAGKTVSSTGKPSSREMGLGPYPSVPLATSTRVDGRVILGARDLADDARRLLREGIDPIKARHDAAAAERRKLANSKTFKDCAEAFIRARRAEWRNDKHAAQWESTLETYAYPKIGAMSVALIETPDVLRVLEPIWTSKPETASRLRGRLEQILSDATARGYREGLNPARWRGHLDQTLPKRSRVARIAHHPALPFQKLPAFLRDLRKQEGVAARAMEFTILTAARTGEAIGAAMPEFNLRESVWTIPGARMKAGREHRVPLTAPVLEIVDRMKALGGEALFPGRNGGALSNMAMLKTLERMGQDELTVHGFRSTFRDWASERTSFPREVIEMALAHAIGDKVEAAYRRGDLFEKRRKLMEAWAQYCEKGDADANVTPIRAAKKA